MKENLYLVVWRREDRPRGKSRTEKRYAVTVKDLRKGIAKENRIRIKDVTIRECWRLD